MGQRCDQNRPTLSCQALTVQLRGRQSKTAKDVCVSGGEEDHEEGSGVAGGQVCWLDSASEKAGATESQHLSRRLKVERNERHSIWEKRVLGWGVTSRREGRIDEGLACSRNRRMPGRWNEVHEAEPWGQKGVGSRASEARQRLGAFSWGSWEAIAEFSAGEWLTVSDRNS